MTDNIDATVLIVGAAMAGILAGMLSPGQMLKPGMALRLLAG